jgi:hypothetical protein
VLHAAPSNPVWHVHVHPPTSVPATDAALLLQFAALAHGIAVHAG